MTDMQEGRAPYASMGSVQKVIEKHRQVGLQSVTLQKLQQIGVTESLAPRTLSALEALGFYDTGGNITPEFDALRKVPEHDFKPRLAALLREAYVPILEVLDPATATQTEVENAFRGFEPTGQIPRMVQLFIQLMVYAEIMPQPEPKRRAVTASHTARAPRNMTERILRNTSAAEPGQAGRTGQSGLSAVKPEHGQQPEHSAPKPPSVVDGKAGERRDISLGDAGSVTVIVNVRWLDLSEDRFTKLRQLIKDIEALGDTDPDHREQEVSP